MTITIRTNNNKRPIVNDWELTQKERKEFDYIDWAGIDAGNHSAQFFRFKGQLYDIGEFTRCPDTAWFKTWDGYFSDSAFSGVLLKWADKQFDSVIIGQYFS